MEAPDGLRLVDNSEITQKNQIEFTVSNSRQEPMLMISDEGFFVRGKKLEQDEHEARAVYEAICAWLADSNFMDL